MQTPSDLYEDVAIAYIRLVRQESQEAAAAVERIQAVFGSHAALRAALILTIVKMEIQENDWIPHMGLYAHLLENYPDALPLTKHAMACCLRVWTATIFEPDEWSELTAA